MTIDRALVLDCPAEDLDNVQVEADGLHFTKQVIYASNFSKHRPDGSIEMEFNVDEDDIKHWVETHNKMTAAGLDVPMPIGHTDDPLKRAATALSLSSGADSKGRPSLFVKGVFKDAKLANDLKNSNVSIYVPPVYGNNGNVFSRPVRHIAFTDYPVVPDLGPLTICCSAAPINFGAKNKMKLADLAKELGVQHDPDLTDEGIAKAISASFNKMKEELAKATEKPADKQTDKPADKQADKSAQAVAASEDTLVFVRENRTLKIDNLLSQCKISAAQHKQLKEKWTCQTLSLSDQPAFDTVVEILASNQPLKGTGAEKSGKQEPQKGDPAYVAPIVARARARAAQANK